MASDQRKKPPQVPGPYLGYSLQTTRFLVRLLEADPDSIISLEVFEDVGVETIDGHRIAEQGKSTSDGENPVSDRAVGLWKTFSNWVDAIEYGDLELNKTMFEIYVSHPRSGKIVSSFSNARSRQEAYCALKRAKEEIWSIGAVSGAIKAYVARVFEVDEEIVCKIIQAFTLVCGSGSPQADLKTLMSKNIGVPPEILDDLLAYCLGWVKEQTDILLEQGKPAIISHNFCSDIK